MLALLNTIFLMTLVSNVNTGDTRNIILWAIVAVVALALVIVMTILSKKRKGNKKDDDDE